MIKDKIKNIGRYSINDYFENFKENFKEVHSIPKKLNPPFKAIPLEYETGSLNFLKFENHKKYIDIHLMIEGSEIIGLNEESNLDRITDYAPAEDFELFTGKPNGEVTLQRGEFLLLFPGEIHVTGGHIGEKTKIKKVVYKIPL